jgi:hypothetical protein
MNNVKVKADKNKNVITVNENNPELGWITLEQEVFQINDRGWLKETTRTALVHGKMSDLTRAGYKEGTQLPGKLVITESLNPFNTDNPDRDLKIAGSTGVICRVDDQPIYRRAFYTTNINAFDEFIPHNNTEEIKEVMEAQKMLNILRPNLASAEETVEL